MKTWKEEDLLDPDDWNSRHYEMPKYCRRIVDGEAIVDGGERVHTLIGRNSEHGWFVVGWGDVNSDKRVIWSQEGARLLDGDGKYVSLPSSKDWDLADDEADTEYYREMNDGPNFSCDDCPHIEPCTEKWGSEEREALIGSHHCRRDWDQFAEDNKMKNNTRHGRYTVGEWRRDDLKAYRADIYIAGDLDTCTRICREECFREGLCVTVESCNFVYTGGAEMGVRVGLIQYPPFPKEEDGIFDRAVVLGKMLALANCQWSFTVCASDKHSFFSRRRS
jgi:hypothetical protein